MNIVKREEHNISLEYIMSKVSDYELYRYYIGTEMKVGVAMPSVFRKDKNPSMSIYATKSGKLRHVDYADDRFKGDPIDMVMQLYGVSLPEALEKIAKDMGLLDNNKQYRKVAVEPEGIRERQRSLIQIITKKLSASEEKWWNSYGISIDQLQSDNVYSVKEVYLNRKRYSLDKSEMVYAYWYPEGIKVYMPQRQKNEKWLSSIPTSLVENIEDADKYNNIIICKSKKDRLTMQAVIGPHIGIIGVQNESTSAYTESLVEKLKGKRVWLSYDSDPPGKMASMRVNKMYPEWKHVNVPDTFTPIKDWSDLYREMGKQPIIEHLKRKEII